MAGNVIAADHKKYFVKCLTQTSSFVFTIEWSDGKLSHFRLSDLQKICPCARCRCEKTGRSLVDVDKLDSQVQAHRLYSVGNYGIKIEFTSGCSSGIYSYSFLRDMAC